MLIIHVTWYIIRIYEAHLPKLSVSIGRPLRRENFAPQKHEQEVVRGRRCPPPSRRLSQVRPHGRQARLYHLLCLLCQELIGDGGSMCRVSGSAGQSKQSKKRNKKLSEIRNKKRSRQRKQRNKKRNKNLIRKSIRTVVGNALGTQETHQEIKKETQQETQHCVQSRQRNSN